MINTKLKILDTTFLLKRGKASVWNNINPVLQNGEPGFETDTGKLKIGNGKDKYNDLAYVGGVPNYEAQLAAVAISGDYDDLINKPTNVSKFNNDTEYITSSSLETTLNDYITSSSLETTLSDYISSSELTEELTSFGQNLYSFDEIPLEDSNNLITSGVVYSTIDQVIQIANGKTACYVFDTTEDLDTWLLVAENVSKLHTGDVFLIRDVDVPDWWWDGTTSTKQRLETTKVDLSGYVQTTSVSNDFTQDGTSTTKIPSVNAVKEFVEGKNYLTSHQSLSGYISTSDRSNSFIDDGNSTTKIPSVNAVKTFVEGKGYLTQHQSLSNCLATSDRSNDFTNDGSSTTKVPSVNAVKEFVENKNYLTQHQSLSNVNAVSVNGYTIQVSNAAPASGTANTVITFVT